MRAMRVHGPLLGAVLRQACYVYTPLYGSAPAQGGRYTFQITDQGRVGLADRLGSGVEEVEGTLVGQDSDAYLVSVTGVKTIDAGASHWSGERVAIREGYVGHVERRVYSTGRTLVAAGVAAAAVGAFIATRHIFGGGCGQTPKAPPPPTGGS